MTTIILASKSKGRREALDILCLKYEVIPSNIDESSIRDSNPKDLAEKLSIAKAKDVGDMYKNAIVIAGDCFVTYKNKIYEKPKTKEEAFLMLKKLSGVDQEVIGGLAVYNSRTGKLNSCADITIVRFRKLTDYEINNYIENNPVLGYSASFDGKGLMRFAESINGSTTGISPFPMHKLIEFLRENNVKV